MDNDARKKYRSQVAKLRHAANKVQDAFFDVGKCAFRHGDIYEEAAKLEIAKAYVRDVEAAWKDLRGCTSHEVFSANVRSNGRLKFAAHVDDETKRALAEFGRMKAIDKAAAEEHERIYGDSQQEEE